MIFLKSALILLMMVFMSPKENVKPHVLSYIEAYKFVAIDEMVRSGIPASITMAQAIIESNAGVSNLARQSNNHFGIKCKEYWTGNAHFHPDDDHDQKGNLIPSCFRKYDSVIASYADHSDFLMNTPHYQPLFVYDKIEYEQWAKGLELCGYASDPDYAEKLIRTIKLYQLHDLDYYTIEYVSPSKLSPGHDLGASQE
jgi:flagellum-specific peptidoglycan hydrolase FlgJ